jgi:carbamoyltransferase
MPIFMSAYRWDDPFPPGCLSVTEHRELRDRLRTLSYDVTTLSARLGVEALHSLSVFYYPIYRHRLRGGTDLDNAILLLLLQSAVTMDEARRVFPGQLFERLLEIGLLVELPGSVPGDPGVRSAVILHPYDEYVFASDPYYFWEGLEERRPHGHEVYIVGKDSVDLADATLRRPVARALDLCTGCGVHAILAAAHVGEAVGVDINPRAVSFARFNAALNGMENVTFLQGDLYGPIAGQTFDLITANPPFVAAPADERMHLYRDGGDLGDDVLKRIVMGLPEHLSADGLFQSVGHIAVAGGMEREERLRAWLNGGGFNVFALDLEFFHRTQLAYAQNFGTLGRVLYEDYAREVTRWLEHLERLGVERLAHSLLAIRRAPEFRFQRATLASRTVTFSTRPPREQIEAWIRGPS